MQSAKVSRVHPRASVIGDKNNPSAERGPNDIILIKQPHTMMNGTDCQKITGNLGDFV